MFVKTGPKCRNETLQPWKPEDRYRHSASLRIGKGPIYSGTCNILLLPPTLSTITDRARTKHGDVDTSPTSAGFLDQQHTRREQTRRTTQSAAVCRRAINLRGGSSSIEHLSRVCVCVCVCGVRLGVSCIAPGPSGATTSVLVQLHHRAPTNDGRLEPAFLRACLSSSPRVAANERVEVR